MSDQLNTVSTTTADNGVEFRVLIQGLKLDQTTRALIDAAIRSAVLREVATIDTGAKYRIVSPTEDAQTRSLKGLIKVLGLILETVRKPGDIPDIE